MTDPEPAPEPEPRRSTFDPLNPATLDRPRYMGEDPDDYSLRGEM